MTLSSNNKEKWRCYSVGIEYGSIRIVIIFEDLNKELTEKGVKVKRMIDHINN